MFLRSFFIFVFVFFTFASQNASASSVFTVRGVQVDETAETVRKAKKAALSKGQIRAFRILLSRLLLKEDLGDLPSLEDKEITAMIQSLGIASEKSSAVRYIAKLNVTFNAKKVRDFLKRHDISYAETGSKPYLVIPFFSNQYEYLLWEEKNPWMNAWNKILPRVGLVPFVLPRGDLQDRELINKKMMLTQDFEKALPLRDKYKASGILFVTASVEDDDVNIELVSLEPQDGEMKQNRIKFSVDKGEEFGERILKAAYDVVFQLEEMWKQANLVNLNKAKEITIELPVKSLRSWVEVQKKLEKISIVQKVSLASMTRTSMHINIWYIGTIEQLRLALAQKNLDLSAE